MTQAHSGAEGTGGTPLRPTAARARAVVLRAIADRLLSHRDQDWAELYAYNDPTDFEYLLKLRREVWADADGAPLPGGVMPLNRARTAFNLCAYWLYAKLPVSRGRMGPDEWREISERLRTLYTEGTSLVMARQHPTVDRAERRAALAWAAALWDRLTLAAERAALELRNDDADFRELRAIREELHAAVALRRPALRTSDAFTAWRALAPREAAVAECLATGAAVKEIAQRLDITEATVWTYLKRIRDKLNLPNVQATTLLRALGVIEI